MRKFLWLGLAALPLAIAGIDELAILPMDSPAIRYTKGPVHDRVHALDQRLAKGEIRLAHNQELGYLPSLLEALGVPQSSQVLVFSKTSFQAPRIAPRTPRALYHCDDVAVGFVRGGDVLELAAVDPQQGVVFYTLDQWETARPSLVRRSECFQCHVGASTLGVPGLVVRSVHVDRSGMALLNAPAFITDHRSPLKQRWGGWYVTGTTAARCTWAIRPWKTATIRSWISRSARNIADLHRYFDLRVPAAYQRCRVPHDSRGPDAHDQPDHPAGMGDAPGSQDDRLNATAEELVAYMLLADETPLTAPIEGSPAYAAEFMAQGPKDHLGRSLRDLDMTTRMFRYPCSFLIYSAQFDGLPPSARQRVYRRLYEVLSGRDHSARYARLSQSDRQAVLEILRDTKRISPRLRLPARSHRAEAQGLRLVSVAKLKSKDKGRLLTRAAR